MAGQGLREYDRLFYPLANYWHYAFEEGEYSGGKQTTKRSLTAKQKKVRKANKKAGKSRAKNRRK